MYSFAGSSPRSPYALKTILKPRGRTRFSGSSSGGGRLAAPDALTVFALALLLCAACVLKLSSNRVASATSSTPSKPDHDGSRRRMWKGFMQDAGEEGSAAPAAAQPGGPTPNADGDR